MVRINAGSRPSMLAQRYRNKNQTLHRFTGHGIVFLGTTLLMYFLYTSTTHQSSSSSSSTPNHWFTFTVPHIRREDQARYYDQQQQQQQHLAPGNIPDHPHLHLISKKDNPAGSTSTSSTTDSNGSEPEEDGETNDYLDSLASDILQTLHCHELLRQHQTAVVNGELVYKNLDAWEDANTIHQQRRLFQQDDAVVSEDSNDDAAISEGQSSQEQQQEHQYDQIRKSNDEVPADDDDRYVPVTNDSSGHITAAHLFCLAAFPTHVPEDMDETLWWQDKVQCAVRGDKQRTLLDLWSNAQAEFVNDVNDLRKTLEVVVEQTVDMVGHKLNVWAAPYDSGTTFLIETLAAQWDATKNTDNNSNRDAEHSDTDRYKGIFGLQGNLGPGKLFVDVGSGLGYTSMAIALLYPGTEIVSIEAASTNWLLQELNWRCNFDDKEISMPRIVLAGIGPSKLSSQAAHFVWRPTATTSTRAWTPNVEEKDNSFNDGQDVDKDDIQLAVKLRPWHMVEAEAEIVGREIAVLNVDCEGCEYNLIPGLSEKDFQAISSILGQLHWGYIPVMKLPSSQRARNTHQRLCQHENFARDAIECCAFPDLTVRSTFSGEVLVVGNERDEGAPNFPEQQATVQYLAGDLCNTFEQWAAEKHLFEVDSDWGWFQGVTISQQP